MRSCIKPQQFSGLGETRSGPKVHVHLTAIITGLSVVWRQQGKKVSRTFSYCLYCLKQCFCPDIPRSQQPKGRAAFTLRLRGAKQEGKQRRLADRSLEGRHRDGVSHSLLRHPPAAAVLWTPLCLVLAPTAQTGNRGTVTGTSQQDNYNLGSASVG